MHARKKLGGEGVIAEAEARKQNLNVPKPLKLVSKGVDQVDLVQGKEEAKSESKKPVGEKPKPAEKIEKPDKKLDIKKVQKAVDEKKIVDKKVVEEKKTKPVTEEKKVKPAVIEKKPLKSESTPQPDKKVGLKPPTSKPDPKDVEKPAKQIAIGKIGNPVADAEQRKIKQAIAAE